MPLPTPPPDAASDGGTAFPFSTTRDTMTSGNWASSPGMMLRDYFAATALNGLIQNGDGPYFGTNKEPFNPWSWYSTEAYRAADAMLATRALLATPGEGEGA